MTLVSYHKNINYSTGMKHKQIKLGLKAKLKDKNN
jgi:hypothetical protein